MLTFTYSFKYHSEGKALLSRFSFGFSENRCLATFFVTDSFLTENYVNFEYPKTKSDLNVRCSAPVANLSRCIGTDGTPFNEGQVIDYLVKFPSHGPGLMGCSH